MYHILYKYLILKNQVNIPGVGQFNVVQLPSRLDYSANVIHAPVSIVQFAPSEEALEKSFFDYVSFELQAERNEAIKQFYDFTYKLSNEISAQKKLQLPGIGIITKRDDKLSFEPIPLIQNYFATVNLGDFNNNNEAKRIRVPQGPLSISIKNKVTQKPQNQRWWIAAIVLGIIGIGAIAYYYITKNMGQ